MRSSIMGVLFLVVSASIAHSKGMTYDCTFKQNDPYNWVPARVMVSMNEAKGTAEAYDGLINHLFGKPIRVKFTRRSAKSVQWDWSLDEIPGKRNRTYRASYKVIINQETKKASIKILVHGFANDPIGFGNCVIMK